MASTSRAALTPNVQEVPLGEALVDLDDLEAAGASSLCYRHISFDGAMTDRRLPRMLRLCRWPLIVAICGLAAGCESKASIDQREESKKTLDRVEVKLAALEQQVVALSATPKKANWACSARCMKSYSCNNQGTSKLDWRDITSDGADAADAFGKLTAQCGGAPFVQGDCVDGKLVRQDATIVNGCVKN